MRKALIICALALWGCSAEAMDFKKAVDLTRICQIAYPRDGHLCGAYISTRSDTWMGCYEYAQEVNPFPEEDGFYAMRDWIRAVWTLCDEVN